MKTSYSPFVVSYDRPKETHGLPGSVLFDLEALESYVIQDIQKPSPALQAWERSMLKRSPERAFENLASLEALVIQDLTAKRSYTPARILTAASLKMATLVETTEMLFRKPQFNNLF